MPCTHYTDTPPHSPPPPKIHLNSKAARCHPSSASLLTGCLWKCGRGSGKQTMRETAPKTPNPKPKTQEPNSYTDGQQKHCIISPPITAPPRQRSCFGLAQTKDRGAHRTGTVGARPFRGENYRDTIRTLACLTVPHADQRRQPTEDKHANANANAWT